MTVCIYFKEMNGNVMTCFDCYTLLKKYVSSVKYVFIVQSFVNFLPFLSYFPKDTKFISQDNICAIKDDIVITSAYTYYNIVSKNLKLDVIADKYIIFDSSCFLHDEAYNIGLIRYISNFSNYVVLGNIFNSKYFDKKHFRLFTHPFSFSRLSQYKIRKTCIYKVTRKQRHNNIHPLEYRGFSYCRHVYIGDIYYENIGRTLFEYLYMERPVYYYCRNKCINDGLSYYLNNIGIDDNKDQIILNKKNEVEKMFTFDIQTFLSLL